jgi:hypothetical protein
MPDHFACHVSKGQLGGIRIDGLMLHRCRRSAKSRGRRHIRTFGGCRGARLVLETRIGE